MKDFNVVAIIPTGLGCKLGGDAGFNTGLKLLAKCCDNIIINPNFCNASDINESPENCWYTEGSIIDRFLEGKFNLKKPKTYNKILLAVNSPVRNDSINAMNAGIWGLGADIELVELKNPLIMKAIMNPDGTAGGIVEGWKELVKQIKDLDFDALALHTPIEYDKKISDYYWKNEDIVNPYGAVEALASKLIATAINKPTAHAPVDFEVGEDEIVRISLAPESISSTYLFCVLKGLHKAPRIVYGKGLNVRDIDFLITPYGCWGTPHLHCINNNIPIIGVWENSTCLSRNGWTYPKDAKLIVLDNYLEVVGYLMSLQAGVNPKHTVTHNFQKI